MAQRRTSQFSEAQLNELYLQSQNKRIVSKNKEH